MCRLTLISTVLLSCFTCLKVLSDCKLILWIFNKMPNWFCIEIVMENEIWVKQLWISMQLDLKGTKYIICFITSLNLDNKRISFQTGPLSSAGIIFLHHCENIFLKQLKKHDDCDTFGCYIYLLWLFCSLSNRSDILVSHIKHSPPKVTENLSSETIVCDSDTGFITQWSFKLDYRTKNRTTWTFHIGDKFRHILQSSWQTDL